ncbi:MAG: hypothetical protein CML29_15875 [Rhizobiales bacterium]|nr:hypothetical protein [Hyphomicrobiales bacterium]|tara:strand:- start:181 stop:456 length:276 start_codon:yes stop_codon:yes gene_type:complete
MSQRSPFRAALPFLATRLFTRPKQPRIDPAFSDPLAHPELAGMSQSELADLPFEPYSLPIVDAVSARGTQAARKTLGASAAKPCNAGACRV